MQDSGRHTADSPQPSPTPPTPPTPLSPSLPAPPPSAAPAGPVAPGGPEHSSNDDTLDLHLDGELTALLAERAAVADASPGTGDDGAGGAARPAGPDLLDGVADWPAARTPAGTFQLVPVRLDRDLRLLTAWMNDPAVAAFWELAGPEETTAAHVRQQLEGDGRSVPCLGVLDGTPVSYWEIYRADLDPIARYCRARPHDTGLHLLIGGVTDRGRGVGSALLRGVADLVLAQRPACGRVLAEPDLRNTASVAAFLSAGFRYSDEVQLPDKRAALMVRDRELQALL